MGGAKSAHRGGAAINICGSTLRDSILLSCNLDITACILPSGGRRKHAAVVAGP